MRASILTIGSLTLLLAACGDDDGDTSLDAGPGVDATTADDASSGSDAATTDAATGDDASVGTDAATPTCGTERPSLAMITGTEGIVIARDGTIYYSQRGGVGRLTPEGTRENAWVTIAGATTVWGLALDAENERLFVGVPSLGGVYAIDTTAADPEATEFVEDAGQPNGLTLGPDGALYYSDFAGGHVYRADTSAATATATRVTASTIAGANGVAFFEDGALLVASYSTGDLLRLELSAAGVETAREPFAELDGVNPDGLAFDAEGRVYVSDNSGGEVLRLDADGSNPMRILMNVRSAASMEFGAGPLDCTDLYVTSGQALRRYEMGETAGAAVPWH